MIVVDTNVLSALMRRDADPIVEAWLDRQAFESIWTTAVTVFEIRLGVEMLVPSRRRRQLEDAFVRALEEDFQGRILPFDGEAARESGRLAASQRRAGRTIDFRDIEIAGIVSTRHAALATRNIRHFADLGIEIVDPWKKG